MPSGLLPYFSNLWSIRALVIAGVLLASSGCGPDHLSNTETFNQEDTQGGGVGQGLFVESASEFGLDFEYVNGATGDLNFYEIMGPGCALFDFDNDGDLDAYLVQGHLLDPDYDPEKLLGDKGLAAVPHDRLYRNDLQALPDGSTRLSFTDVTRSSGITGVEYGMGAATGDIDNDGWTDLYVTNVGRNRLWRNNGDGTFTDITATSGTDDPEWSTSASFVDIDSDGWLDLYVANYLHYGYFNHRPCNHPSSAPEYCGPKTYPAVADRLFRNNGDGLFEDRSRSAGLAQASRRHTTYAALCSTPTMTRGSIFMYLTVQCRYSTSGPNTAGQTRFGSPINSIETWGTGPSPISA